jgi:hypothetical protein
MSTFPIETQTRVRRSGIRALVSLFTIVLCLAWQAHQAAAQTAGEGSLQGTATDSTGAVVPDATVTATNTATSQTTVRSTTSAGFFNISPLLPREFVFEADCINTWNNVVFAGPSANWTSGSSTFGTIGSISNSPRDWQFAGHINF